MQVSYKFVHAKLLKNIDPDEHKTRLVQVSHQHAKLTVRNFAFIGKYLSHLYHLANTNFKEAQKIKLSI